MGYYIFNYPLQHFVGDFCYLSQLACTFVVFAQLLSL
jgi:hypothetical protein